MVYNFGPVCISVRQMITFERVDIESSFCILGLLIFAHVVYLQGICVKFVYEGHRVKVKVTGARKVEK